MPLRIDCIMRTWQGGARQLGEDETGPKSADTEQKQGRGGPKARPREGEDRWSVPGSTPSRPTRGQSRARDLEFVFRALALTHLQSAAFGSRCMYCSAKRGSAHPVGCLFWYVPDLLSAAARPLLDKAWLASWYACCLFVGCRAPPARQSAPRARSWPWPRRE